MISNKEQIKGSKLTRQQASRQSGVCLTLKENQAKDNAMVKAKGNPEPNLVIGEIAPAKQPLINGRAVKTSLDKENGKEYIVIELYHKKT